MSVITRTAWTDDDGTGTTGTIINNAEKTTLYNQIDAALPPYDRDVSVTDVVNTVTETTVYTKSVSGGTLSTNKALRLSLIGDYLNNSGGNAQLTVRVKYGATTFLTAVIGAIASNANRRALTVDALLSAANATNAQVSRGTIILGETNTAAGSATTPSVTSRAVHNSIAIDSTAAQNLVVTFQHDTANANISAKAFVTVVEWL